MKGRLERPLFVHDFRLLIGRTWTLSVDELAFRTIDETIGDAGSAGLALRHSASRPTGSFKFEDR